MNQNDYNQEMDSVWIEKIQDNKVIEESERNIRERSVGVETNIQAHETKRSWWENNLTQTKS